MDGEPQEVEGLEEGEDPPHNPLLPRLAPPGGVLDTFPNYIQDVEANTEVTCSPISNVDILSVHFRSPACWP